MTDADLTRECAERFFGLEGVGLPSSIRTLLPSDHLPHPGPVRAYIRQGDRAILSSVNTVYIGKRYPDPLNDDRDACAVLDKMAQEKDPWNYDLTQRHGVYRCHFWRNWSAVGDEHSCEHTCADRRRAIVVAALKAVGVKVE